MGDSQAASSIDAASDSKDNESLMDGVDNEKPMGEIDDVEVDVGEKDKKDENKILDELKNDKQESAG